MSGEALFRRKVKLIVAAPLDSDYKSISVQTTEITDLRVQFKVVKTLGKEPNTCEITVTNLSAHTRGQLPGKGAKVVLQAGYEQTLSQIHFGDATLIESRREG